MGEKEHSDAIKTYRTTHATNTLEISRLDREKRILTEIRRLLGVNRSSRYVGHRDQAEIKKAEEHNFDNYKDSKSQFNHGAQRFHNHWVELSYVTTETEKVLGVNLRGINNKIKKAKFVNQGTILDWDNRDTNRWTSYGFDLSKIVFRALDKQAEGESVVYIALQTPYHKCGLDTLEETQNNFHVMPELLVSKDGAVATCYKGTDQISNCYNQIVIDTSRYQPLGILDIESLGKCHTGDNSLRFKFTVFGQY